MRPPAAARPDADTIAALRARIGAIDGSAGASLRGAAVALGLAAIDAALPWRGLPRGCLHELIGDDGSAAAAGFAALLLARFAGADASVVWCRRPGRGPDTALLYPAGLAALGLDPARLLVVHAGGETEVLWAMEDALRCRALAAVLGESRALAPVAWRRLQLAAATHGVTALLLRPGGQPGRAGPRRSEPAAAGAVTRWRIAAIPNARWRLELLRCRGGVPAAWLVEWCDETHRLALAAEPFARPAAGADRFRRAG